MNAGNMHTSRRLRETANVLEDGLEHSSAEIHARTGSMAVHSDVAALRGPPNNLVIQQRYDGVTEGGARISKYRWVRNTGGGA